MFRFQNSTYMQSHGIQFCGTKQMLIQNYAKNSQHLCERTFGAQLQIKYSFIASSMLNRLSKFMPQKVRYS